MGSCHPAGWLAALFFFFSKIGYLGEVLRALPKLEEKRKKNKKKRKKGVLPLSYTVFLFSFFSKTGRAAPKERPLCIQRTRGACFSRAASYVGGWKKALPRRFRSRGERVIPP